MLLDTLWSFTSWAAIAIVLLLSLLWRKHPHASKPLPARLNDPRWGEHGYVEANGTIFHYVSKGDHKLPLMLVRCMQAAL